MLTTKIPGVTVDADPAEYLKKLKDGKIEFEEVGFATSLSDHPTSYAGAQLSYLQLLVKDEALWKSYGREAMALFVKEYYLRTLLIAANQNLWEKLDIERFYPNFCNMQKVLREVFPFWIESDLLYGLGKNMLNILRSANIDIPDADSLKALLTDVAILGLPPSVSIVMTACNGSAALEKTLPSILNQSYESFELIVVDDGTDKHTKEVVDAFGNPKIIYICTEGQSGKSVARNIGIQNTHYNYIAFADAGDLWEEKKLEIQMQALFKDASAGFCYSECRVHDEKGNVNIMPRRTISLIRKDGYIYPELLCRNTTNAPAFVIKKECIDVVGGFNETLHCYEDWEFLLRVARVYKGVFCPMALFDIYEDKDGVLGKTKKELEQEKAKFYESYAKDCLQFGIQG